MKRRNERQFALQTLYSLEYNDLSLTEMLDRLDEKQKKSASDFSLKLIEECIRRKEELDKYIKPQLKNWDYNRVAVIDRILLRMAVVEFLYFESVPPEATLNEMIEISKEFSTERSGKFINGILDAILKKLRKQKKLKKSGRGLVPPGAK